MSEEINNKARLMMSRVFSYDMVPESIMITSHHKRFPTKKEFGLIKLPKKEMDDLFQIINNFGREDFQEEKVTISKQIADDLISMIEPIGTERAKFIIQLLKID